MQYDFFNGIPAISRWPRRNSRIADLPEGCKNIPVIVRAGGTKVNTSLSQGYAECPTPVLIVIAPSHHSGPGAADRAFSLPLAIDIPAEIELSSRKASIRLTYRVQRQISGNGLAADRKIHRSGSYRIGFEVAGVRKRLGRRGLSGRAHYQKHGNKKKMRTCLGHCSPCYSLVQVDIRAPESMYFSMMAFRPTRLYLLSDAFLKRSASAPSSATRICPPLSIALSSFWGAL